MTVVVLLILAALWVVVLAPPLLRARSENRGGDSIGDFNYRLGALGKANGNGNGNGVVNPVSPPPAFMNPVPPLGLPRSGAAQRSAKRRRDVLTTLGSAAAVTFLLAYVSGAGALWAVHVIADVLIVVYVGLIAWYRQLATERLEKVRFLPHRAPPELALRRTASS